MCALARASRSLNCRAQGHHLAQYLSGPTTTRTTTTTRLRERRVQTGRWIVVLFSGSLGLTHLKQVCSEYSSPWHLVCHVSLHPSLGRSHALLISIAKVISRSLGRQLQSLKVVIGASERERKSSIVYHPGGTRNLFVVVPRICLRPPRGPVKGSCSSRPSLTPAEEGVPSLCRRLANKENGASVVVRKTDRQTEREREREEGRGGTSSILPRPAPERNRARILLGFVLLLLLFHPQ